MADNLAVTPGSGATMAADEATDGTLGSVKIPFAKIMDGTLDSTNKLIVNSSGEAKVVDTAGDASLASIDGKITAVNTGAVTISSALPAGTNAIGKLAANSGVDIGDVDITSVTPGTTATALGKAEDAAHSSGDTGVFVLGVRNDAMATLTNTDGDYSAIATSKSGRVLVTPAPADTFVSGNASATNTTDTSVVAAAGVGLKNYITNISVANTGSSTTLITLKDGSGGSTLWYTIAPAGGGSNIALDVPIATTANTALYFAAGTASTTVYVSAIGYKAP